MSVRPAVVDSSGWIEVFTDGPQASSFVVVLASQATSMVPVISILEVFNWVLPEHSEAQAIQAVAAMQRGLSHAHRLPMAGCTPWMPTSAASATTWN